MTAKDSLRVRMGLVGLVSGCLSPTWSHYLSLVRPSSGLLPSAVSYPPAKLSCAVTVLCTCVRAAGPGLPCSSLAPSGPKSFLSLFIMSQNQRILELKSQKGC